MDRNRNLRKQLVMLFGDFLLMYVSLFVALSLRHFRFPDVATLRIHIPPFTIIFIIWVLVLFINGLYDISKARNSTFFFKTFFQSLVVSLLLAMGFFYAIPSLPIEPRTSLVLTIIVYAVLLVIWRIFIHSIITSRALRKRVLFIGARGEAFELIDAINSNPQFGYQVVAILDPNSTAPTEHNDGIQWLTNLHDLKEFVQSKKIATVVVSPNPVYRDAIARELFDTIFWAIEITDLVSFYETILGRIPVTALSEAWFMENLQESQKKHYDLVKTMFDYVIAAGLSVIAIVIIPCAMLAMYLEDKGKFLYTQKRVGKNGKEFMMYKFRTMHPDAEKNGAQFAEVGDPRITRVGKFMRKTRIDELPQIINIIRGDMTFVGPRPERPEFVKYFAEVIPFYSVRTLVKPGLTGWAQINYPYYATVGENMKKLQYDLYYIKNRSPFLDTRILLKTINTVMRWMGV